MKNKAICYNSNCRKIEPLTTYFVKRDGSCHCMRCKGFIGFQVKEYFKKK